MLYEVITPGSIRQAAATPTCSGSTSPTPTISARARRALRRLEGRGLSAKWRTDPGVITSYSIHYTKLYEAEPRVAAPETRSAERTRSIDRGGSALPGASHPPKFEAPLTSISPKHLRALHPRTLHLGILQRRPFSVITSYSIHYTKLYEPAAAGRPATQTRSVTKAMSARYR